MRFLAHYIARGRMQAMFATALCAVASLLLMPLSWPVSYLSGAVVGLVTLMQGPREGLLNVLGGAVLLGLLAAIGLGQPQLALGFVLLIWLPVWLLAQVLRQSVSLPATLLVAGGIGCVLVIAAYLILHDPAAAWQRYFTTAVLPAFKQAGLSAPRLADMRQASAQLAGMMTGMVSAVLVLGSVAAVLLARWWQALLYRPDGFRREFHALRLGKPAGGVAALVFAFAAIPHMGAMGKAADDLLFVIAAVFALQGLAVAHAGVRCRHASVGWLAGLYVLATLIPYVALLLAAAGVVDNWLDFRSRLHADGQN